jgi:hypothetical protein
MGSLVWSGDAKAMATGMKIKDLYGRPLGDARFPPAARHHRRERPQSAA